MIKVIIVDDEEHVRLNLKLMLDKYSDVQIVSEAENAEKAIEAISLHRTDLVFLDIKMPGQNGFDVLDAVVKLGVINFDVIFMTAFDEFAIKAIKYSAFDYLLKPVDENELRISLIRYRLKDKSNLVLNNEVLQKNFLGCQKIRIKTKNGYEYIDPNNIVFIEGDGNYSILTMKDSTNFTICKTLKVVAEELSSDLFVRIHKARLINTKFLSRYDIKTKTCLLKAENIEYILQTSSRMMKNIL